MSEDERLQKYLSRAGVASRRAAETLIVDGKVQVNNRVVTELGTKVRAGVDLVTIDGKLIALPGGLGHFILYKPIGVVTTLSDPQGRSTVKDFLEKIPRRVYPVGRLDYDAEGALLLTDDGDLAHRLTHPSFGVERRYLAKVKGEPQDEALERLRAGVRLEDGPAVPKSVRIFEHAEKNTWLEIVVSEGRPHLIKRMCAAIGHPVVRLFRPTHGGIGLAGLRPGQWRALSPAEVERVRAVSKGEVFPEAMFNLPARRHGRSGDGADREERDERSALRIPSASRPEGRRPPAAAHPHAKRADTAHPHAKRSEAGPAHAKRPEERRGDSDRPAPQGRRFSGNRPWSEERAAGTGRPQGRRFGGERPRTEGRGGSGRAEERGFSGGRPRPEGRGAETARPEGRRFGAERPRSEGRGGGGRPEGRGGRPEGRGFSGGRGRPEGRGARPEGRGAETARPEGRRFGAERPRSEGRGGGGRPEGRGGRPEGRGFGAGRSRPEGRGAETARPEGRRFGVERPRTEGRGGSGRPEGRGFGGGRPRPEGRGAETARPEGRRFSSERPRTEG